MLKNVSLNLFKYMKHFLPVPLRLKVRQWVGPRRMLFRYDFIDFGASKGGGIKFAKAALGGVSGFGIDFDPRKIKLMQDSGFECMQGDITKNELPAGCVKFVIMSHILEHLRGKEDASLAISSAARLSRSFVYIQGPYFDADVRLKKLGLKFFWSHWKGHTYHMTSKDLRSIFESLGITDYKIYFRQRIEHSSDINLHSLASRKDQFEYDPVLHPPKVLVALEPPVWKEIVAIVRKDPSIPWSELDAKVRDGVVASAVDFESKLDSVLTREGDL